MRRNCLITRQNLPLGRRTNKAQSARAARATGAAKSPRSELSRFENQARKRPDAIAPASLSRHILAGISWPADLSWQVLAGLRDAHGIRCRLVVGARCFRGQLGGGSNDAIGEPGRGANWRSGERLTERARFHKQRSPLA